jgi:hypothetical protein
MTTEQQARAISLLQSFAPTSMTVRVGACATQMSFLLKQVAARQLRAITFPGGWEEDDFGDGVQHLCSSASSTLE